MPTYIMLSTLTPDGVQTVKNNPSRIKEVNREVEQLGATVKAQWATLGHFDFVNVIEAPDEKTIARVSLEGKVLEERFLPAPGATLNKPKGMWVEGRRLWVTDIDVVWLFDLKTRRGKKVDLPATFANDLTVRANVLFVSDNRADQLYRVEPADFLETKDAPKVTLVFSGKSVNPNGLYPARDGSLLMAGFMSAEQPRGIYALTAGGEIKAVSKNLGQLDGLYQMDDGTLLSTDWKSGTLFRWSSAKGMEPLASGFKGPADFCVVPEAGGLLVVVPDLVKGELRMVRLAR